MNVTELLERTEHLQQLLDRRARLIQDAASVETEIRAAYAELGLGDVPSNGTPEQKALPPAGARQDGTARRAPTSRSKKTSKRKAKASNGDTVGGKTVGGDAGTALTHIQSRPRTETFRSTDLAKAVKTLDAMRASNALGTLCRDGKLKRVARGEYRLK